MRAKLLPMACLPRLVAALLEFDVDARRNSTGCRERPREPRARLFPGRWPCPSINLGHFGLADAAANLPADKEHESCTRKLTILSTALLLWGPKSVTAGHFHYISITDARFEKNDQDSELYDPDWVIGDDFGDTPFEEWVVYTGLDDDITIYNDGLTFSDSTGDAAAQEVFDYPFFADYTNPDKTVFIEFRVPTLDSNPGKTIEIGVTDLVNRVRMGRKASRRFLRMSNLLRATSSASLPLGKPGLSGGSSVLSLYYNFHCGKPIVVRNESTDETMAFSRPNVGEPFLNFYPEGVPGTDPNNLSIYFYTLAVSPSLHGQHESFGEPELPPTDGGVDPAGCAPKGPRPLGSKAFSDNIEATFLQEHTSGAAFDVDANDGNLGGTDNNLTYAIIDGNNDGNRNGHAAFAIDPLTGVIAVNDPEDLDLDTPCDHTFTLEIEATDRIDLFTSSALMIFVLQDIDDGDPRHGKHNRRCH